MKNVIVTGVAGFLGSHLAKHHLDAGDRVLGLDDFCSSDPKSAHLSDLRGYEGFSFTQSDITEPDTRIAAAKWFNCHGGVDTVYNFACPASPPRYQEMPVHTMLTCVAGTQNMLEIADQSGAVFVHASTSEVYGDPDCSPQPEFYRGCVNSYGPRACYDEGKRAAEALCFDYRNAHGVDARLVRIFNTYGPNMDPFDGRVVSNFIRQALKGEPLTIYGGGQQTRSLCYVSDLIRGIVRLGELGKNPCMPINLGNPHEVSIADLALVISDKLNAKTFRAEHSPLPTDDPQKRCPDVTMAKAVLGWEPTVGLHEGLEMTIEHFRRVLAK